MHQRAQRLNVRAMKKSFLASMLALSLASLLHGCGSGTDAANAVGDDLKSHRHCAHDSNCYNGYICVAGYCTSPTACHSNGDCPAGEICSNGKCQNAPPPPQCTSNGNCTKGEVCVKGACQPCTSTSQCDAGLVCTSGACGTPPPPQCTANHNCANGEVCVGGACQACTSTTQCDAGLVCSNGACGTPPPPPQCTTNSDCPSGEICQGGTCVAGGGTDGTPTRTSSCTPTSQETGTAINTAHGRLDGFVTYVLPVNGSRSCNGDSGHIHVQVRANGSIYDVAVNVGSLPGDAALYEADMVLPDGAWSEGWHNDALSYKSLGLTSSQFTPQDPTALAQKLESELASANHISVFGTAYSSKNGCHDIHYYNGNDGALVLQPLSATPHVLFFRFSNQSF